MPEPQVKFSQRLWSQEVAAVEALDTLDTAPGVQGAQALADRQQSAAYEFANGKRVFRHEKNPYT